MKNSVCPSSTKQVLNLATSVVPVLFSLSIFQGQTAHASGEIYLRRAEASSIQECKGSLVERLHTGGNMHGFFSFLTIACLRSRTSAEWVLISGTYCDDPSDDPKLCNTDYARSIPELVVNGDFWDRSKQQPPFNMKYKLIKYGFGTECEEVRQPVKHSFASEKVAWLCKGLTISDGTRDTQTFQSLIPSNFTLLPVETSSKEPLVPFGESLLADDFANEFIVDSDQYSYAPRAE